jgi:PHP family Zn ribbon phosphoesterase
VGITLVYDKKKKRKPFVSLVPLFEILLEINKNSQTKVLAEYERLTSSFATEFDILLKKSYEEIEEFGGTRLAEAIKIVRERKVFVDPGYDGVFGKVKVFNNETTKTNETQQKKTEEQQLLF